MGRAGRVPVKINRSIAEAIKNNHRLGNVRKARETPRNEKILLFNKTNG
jgi:hypothetical protein